jgi:NAD+ synthase
MGSELGFSREVLRIDAAVETERITATLRDMVVQQLRKRGAVVALSGGIDSSVVGALCVRALGRERVFGLLLPEAESSDETRRLSTTLVEHLGIAYAQEEITPMLDAVGCYRRRDEAIRSVIPDYRRGWKSKIVLPSVADSDMLRVFSVIAQSPDGVEMRARLTPQAYLGVVAATNFKQRVRKLLEYYHADRLNYAVAGTPNRLEHDQGFFVKNGDGAADFKPIAHLYKGQVYQLAAHLGLPDEIRARPPTTDTYSLPQTQEEFYFSLPYDQMDLCLYARTQGVSAQELARVLELRVDQVQRIYRDIDAKRSMARYLHMLPLLADPLPASHR